MKTNKSKSSAKNSAGSRSAKKTAKKSTNTSSSSAKKVSKKLPLKKKAASKKATRTLLSKPVAKKTVSRSIPAKRQPASTPVQKKLTPPSKRIAEQQSKYPGYPAYKEEDDIMNKGKRTEAELDTKKGAPIIKSSRPKPTTDNDLLDDEAPVKKKGPNDITKEDLLALGDDELESDGGDDEELRNRVTKVDFAGSDLDVPDDDEDSAAEEAGSEDEENKIYSLGGDNHEDLEEDKS